MSNLYLVDRLSQLNAEDFVGSPRLCAVLVAVAHAAMNLDGKGIEIKGRKYLTVNPEKLDRLVDTLADLAVAADQP